VMVVERERSGRGKTVPPCVKRLPPLTIVRRVKREIQVQRSLVLGRWSSWAA